MKFSWLSDKGVLIEDIDASLRGGLIELIEQSVPGLHARMGMHSILVLTDQPNPQLLTTVQQLLADTDISHLPHADGKHFEIPTRFDGEDLAAVASALHLTPSELIADFTDIDWRVELIGFAPGFPYLKPIHESTWLESIGRLDSPRTRVPAGSVAIAAGMAAVYPSAMPGGWRLIGRTDVMMFDSASDRPSLLAVGDTVRFVEVTP